jgi:hypothetical protein
MANVFCRQKPTIDSILHDSNPQPLAVTIAEASRPYRQLQRQARSKRTRNLGRKRKWGDTDALRVNWQSPLLWPTIEMAALRVGHGMSPVQIERELK